MTVSRQRQLLPFLGLKEGVGEGDGVHPCHSRIVVEFRVDVEEDGHVDLLARVQPLLLEAEALRKDRSWRRTFWNVEISAEAHLDLVEVLPGVKGHHVVGGDADDGFVGGVFGSVEGERRLTWNYLQEQLSSATVGETGGATESSGIHRSLSAEA